MATCQEIMDLLDRIVPFSCVAKKDNSGLLVGDGSYAVDRVLMAVDLTEAVITEAAAKGCGMIVTHHHIMGKGIKTVTAATFEGRAIQALLEHKIAFCACHNNLDFLTDGTADSLMTAIGAAKPTSPLYEGYAFLATTPQETNATAIPTPQGEGVRPGLYAGFGCIGVLPEPCTLKEIIRRLAGIVTGPVNIVGQDDCLIRKVACQVGAGEKSDIDRAKALGADLFISGDVRHDNRLYAAQEGLCLLDFCHYEVELPGVLTLAANLRDYIAASGYGVEVLISQAEAPVRHMMMPPDVDLSRFGLE